MSDAPHVPEPPVPFAGVVTHPDAAERPRAWMWPIAVSWAAVFAVPFCGSLWAVAIGAAHVAHSALGRRRYAVLSVLLAPAFLLPALGFASGTRGYFRGTGTLLMTGLPSMEAENLNRELRCYKRSTG